MAQRSVVPFLFVFTSEVGCFDNRVWLNHEGQGFRKVHKEILF